MALFAGSTFGLTADTCPVNEGTNANLGSELLAAGETFKGYSEGLPTTGSTTCTSGSYARKHSPWINFSNVPAADSLPFTSFPTNYAAADRVVRHPEPQRRHAQRHDHPGRHLAEEQHVGLRDLGEGQQQPADRHLGRGRLHREQPGPHASFVGAGVKPGHYSETVSHYNVLATLEQMYGLTKVGSQRERRADHRHLEADPPSTTAVRGTGRGAVHRPGPPPPSTRPGGAAGAWKEPGTSWAKPRRSAVRPADPAARRRPRLRPRAGRRVLALVRRRARRARG